jgi:hypothetical protein
MALVSKRAPRASPCRRLHSSGALRHRTTGGAVHFAERWPRPSWPRVFARSPQVARVQRRRALVKQTLLMPGRDRSPLPRVSPGPPHFDPPSRGTSREEEPRRRGARGPRRRSAESGSVTAHAPSGSGCRVHPQRQSGVGPRFSHRSAAPWHSWRGGAARGRRCLHRLTRKCGSAQFY